MEKSIFLILAMVGFSAHGSELSMRIPASAQSLTLKCETPTGYAGLSAKLTGTLKLSSLPNGAMKAIGPIQISLLNPRQPWNGKKTVMGQYDDLTSVGSDKYFHGGAQINGDSDIMAIYVNFSRPDTSYVEYGNETYKTLCK